MWPATPCPAPGSQGKQTTNQSSRWNSQQPKGKCLMPPGVLPLFPSAGGNSGQGGALRASLMCSEVSSPGQSPQEAFIHSSTNLSLSSFPSSVLSTEGVKQINRPSPLCCSAQGPVSGELGECPIREAQKTTLGAEERNLPSLEPPPPAIRGSE